MNRLRTTKDFDLLQTAIVAAIEGGKKILEIYGEDFTVDYKADNSPLTMADRKSHNEITRRLEATGLPVLSEEGKNIPYDARKEWKRFWLVDPLDGTKEFVKRNGEFTVNIALVEDGSPVAGVILVPVTRTLYFATLAAGAYKCLISEKNENDTEAIHDQAETLPLADRPDVLTVVCSRTHMSAETAEFIEKIREQEPNLEFVSAGSSLKLCMVAEGKAHLYPRFGPTMEWDTAAGHAILSASGGKVVQAGTEDSLRYNKPDLLNPWFIAGRPSHFSVSTSSTSNTSGE